MDQIDLLVAAAVRDRAVEFRTYQRNEFIKSISPASDKQAQIDDWESKNTAHKFLREAYNELKDIRDFIESIKSA